MSAAHLGLEAIAAYGMSAIALLYVWSAMRKDAVRKRKDAVRKEEDAHHAEVLSWREAKPGETPGTVEPDDTPAPVFVAASPLLTDDDGEDLIDRAERIGARAAFTVQLLTSLERRTYGPGRHRAVGLRDPHRAAIQSPTIAFKALVEAETGEPLTDVGPAEELIHRRLVWEGECWQQQALDVGSAS